MKISSADLAALGALVEPQRAIVRFRLGVVHKLASTEDGRKGRSLESCGHMHRRIPPTTAYRWAEAYRKRGVFGLVDLRKVPKAPTSIDVFVRRFREFCVSAWKALRGEGRDVAAAARVLRERIAAARVPGVRTLQVWATKLNAGGRPDGV